MKIIRKIIRIGRALKKIIILFLAIFHRRNRKNIWVFGSPNHSNLGDMLRHIVFKIGLKKFSKHEVFVFIQFVGREIWVLNFLRKFIGKDDLLFCHSGYHMTDLYPLLEIYEAVIQKFHDYPVVVFPQTVYFKDEKKLMKAVAVFDAHPNCTLLCRDGVSYEVAKKVFRKTKLLLYPDVVTSLIGNRKYENERDGILFCSE